MTVPDSGPMSRAHRVPFPPLDKVSTGGVGSLPGTPNEIDVVRLPEERLHATQISSDDSYAPSNVVQSKTSQEFPLPQRSSKVSMNPFRNGQFASIDVSPSKSAPEHWRERDGEDSVLISNPPRELVGAAITSSLRESSTFPKVLHKSTPGGRKISRESTPVLAGASVEEIETLLEKRDSTPRNVPSTSGNALLSITTIAFSVLMRAYIISRYLGFSVSKGPIVCMSDAKHNDALSKASFMYPGTEQTPERARFSLQEPLSSITPHPAALTTTISDAPSPAKEKVLSVGAEPLTNSCPVVAEPGNTMPTGMRLSNEGSHAPSVASTAFAGTDVGAAVPIIPGVIQSSRGQTSTQSISASHTQPSTAPSPSKTPLSTQDIDSQSKAHEEETGNPTVMSEKLKEGSQVKEVSKGFFPRLSRWFCESILLHLLTVTQFYALK